MWKKYTSKLKLILSRYYIIALTRIERTHEHFHEWNESRLDTLNRKTTILLILAFVVGSLVYVGLFRPNPNFPTEQFFTIEQGDDLSTIAMNLENEGIVRDALILELTVRVLGGARTVKAGDYLFAKPMGTFAIARTITTGNFGLEPIRITIPEGATVVDMATIYEKRLYRFDGQKFIDIALPYEGYLYPDTYFFLPNATEEEILRSMNDNFRQQVAQFEDDIKASPYTFHEIVTLASIIQKEAWKPRDQKLISGVLHNRLERNMRLQVDATFTYTHNKGTYQITLDELQDEENPYNTYVHKGLPPGPIGAVGFTALDAALHPTKSNYLFYLADRNGNTYYSRTYKEHLAKKRVHVD